MSSPKTKTSLSVVNTKEKNPRVSVKVTTQNGESNTYDGEYFGKSLEMEDFFIVGSTDPKEPVYLIKLDTIISVEAREYEA